jgi:hypothetical protein
MSDTYIAAPPELERDALVETLKRELASKTEEVAVANARSELFEDKERSRVGAWKDDCKYFVNELMLDVDAESKADMAPLATWVDEYSNKKDITAQTALARGFSVASAKFKRLREDASVSGKASETLGATMKELEDLKASDKSKSQRISDLETLADERQKSAEKLQAQLSKAGLLEAKFDFSKLASREKVAEPSAAIENALGAVTVNASKGAASSSKANPFEAGGGLAQFVMNRSSGGLRVGASGTQHALLGSTDNNTDIAAALRAM